MNFCRLGLNSQKRSSDVLKEKLQEEKRQIQIMTVYLLMISRVSKEQEKEEKFFALSCPQAETIMIVTVISSHVQEKIREEREREL